MLRREVLVGLVTFLWPLKVFLVCGKLVNLTEFLSPNMFYITHTGD